MSEPAAEGRGRTRILLVDDNVDHVHIAVRAFKENPRLEVEVARFGQECLRKLADAKPPFDLLVLDYRLPDMTGLDLMEKTSTPTIVMTSQGSEEVAMRALERGAVNYVVKDANFGRRLRYEVERWAEEQAE